MVDVSQKPDSERRAAACATISMQPETFSAVRNQTAPKGNVLETARIAGIMAAKKTAELIPMCHPLNLTLVQVDFFPDSSAAAIRIEARVQLIGRTGAEMEALTAAAVAALTIYDMCKSSDRAMVIHNIFLLEKSGGKSGTFRRTVDHG